MSDGLKESYCITRKKNSEPCRDAFGGCSFRIDGEHNELPARGGEEVVDGGSAARWGASCLKVVPNSNITYEAWKTYCSSKGTIYEKPIPYPLLFRLPIFSSSEMIQLDARRLLF
ncbi:hypothetical protein Nepgr_005717 [Nepenthes gracilis]|uniref:Uncharacterized protein n=1 Tax=Nepenthes gracilis TaxID=150966 RepID=A0AAD3S3P9_NEPGR|nr:hypothetical protein Nepgr_005717 [Nepenthes gracilis]